MLVLFSVSAQAATVEPIESISQNALEDFADSVADLKDLWPSDAYVQVDKFAIMKRERDESLPEILKQVILRARALAGTEVPKQIDIEKRHKTTAELKEAVAAALTHAQYNEATKEIPRLADQLGRALDTQAGLQLFTASEISGFTFCQSLAVVDDNAEEVLVISSCWVD